jgi:hypothetical protein
MVAKSFVWKMDPKTALEENLQIIKVHTLAELFAKEFNKKKPTGVSSMQFGTLALIELVDRSPHVIMTVENLLSGSFEKFNNNNGFIKAGHEGYYFH